MGIVVFHLDSHPGASLPRGAQHSALEAGLQAGNHSPRSLIYSSLLNSVYPFCQAATCHFGEAAPGSSTSGKAFAKGQSPHDCISTFPTRNLIRVSPGGPGFWDGLACSVAIASIERVIKDSSLNIRLDSRTFMTGMLTTMGDAAF